MELKLALKVSNLDNVATIFANDIKDEAGVDNPSVVIEINTKDGKNLFSKTYNATK